MMASSWISRDGKFHAELYVGNDAFLFAGSSFRVLDHNGSNELKTADLQELQTRRHDSVTLENGWFHYVWNKPFEVDGNLTLIYGNGIEATIPIEGLNLATDSDAGGDVIDPTDPYGENMGLGEDLDGDGDPDLYGSDLLTHDQRADPTSVLVGLRGGSDGIEVYGEENQIALLVYDLGGSVYTNGTAQLILNNEVVGYAYGKTIRNIKIANGRGYVTAQRATGVVFTSFVWKSEAVMPTSTPRTYQFRFEPTVLAGSTRSIDEEVSLSSTSSSVVNSQGVGGAWIAEPLQSEWSRFD